jgi:hypothetical protein
MHNSQDGASMRFDTLDSPLPILLRGSCIYCHSGLNTAASIPVDPPKVIATATPTYSGLGATGAVNQTLAGGDFWYVNNVGQQTGHNVALVSAGDTTLTNTPPGGAALGGQLQCAGTLGCHGDRLIADPLSSLSGSHHSAHNNQSDTSLDGSTVGLSFRYLLGVLGREDSDWQFVENTTTHNIYNGLSRNAANALPSIATISGLCAQCHGAYHSTVGGADAYGINTDNTNFAAGQWVRHPTDYSMPLTGEYLGYDTYEPETPVGKTNLANPADQVNTLADRVVLCVSCHRAHGSPYADALRWSYGTMDVGIGVTNGCMNCHTAK